MAADEGNLVDVPDTYEGFHIEQAVANGVLSPTKHGCSCKITLQMTSSWLMVVFLNQVHLLSQALLPRMCVLFTRMSSKEDSPDCFRSCIAP
jgi:hypothetical protein